MNNYSFENFMTKVIKGFCTILVLMFFDLQANTPYAPAGEEQAVVWLTVKIPGNVAYGTGVLVSPGLIVTARHVIEGANENAEFYFMNNGTFSSRTAKIIYSAQDSDLAILLPQYYSGDQKVFLEFCRRQIIHDGGFAILWGYPMQTYPNPNHFNRYELYVYPKVSKEHKKSYEIWSKIPQIEFSSKIVEELSKRSLYFDGRAYQGNSGGPILIQPTGKKNHCIAGIISSVFFSAHKTQKIGRAESVEMLPNLKNLNLSNTANLIRELNKRVKQTKNISQRNGGKK